ncbi:MAG: DegT/DnrJ/EryC1/StrS aminotransferase family protein [Deltaproteobacteria bacterium]|nr:MAG: DegT/DnrJ/EryC1/StrS aminotransferase family protein [Deltaproteobacteria bacterium]
MIPHSRPTLGQAEIEQVVKVLESGHIAQGERVHAFEQEFARRHGLDNALCASSGTAALHLVLLALKIGPKNEVIIPSYVCSALLNAVRYVGATPVPAEIDPETYNLAPADVKKRLTKRTRAIIVPHLFGLAADLEGFSELDIPIIEDCAQATGATYKHKPVGTFGKAAIFSFYATKVMTTGEGGMIVTNSREIIDYARDFREYDKTETDKIRFNYKMTDIQAAIGLAQLERLESFIRRRRTIAQKYQKALSSIGFRLPPEDPEHIYFRYVIDLGTDSAPMIRGLKGKGIQSARPIHTPLHRYLRRDGYPKTDEAWNQCLSIPIYPSLTDQEIKRVIKSVTETYEEVSRAGNS